MNLFDIPFASYVKEKREKMTEISKRWRNVAVRIERILRGDLITVEVVGGFVKVDAPADGFMVHTRGEVEQEIYFTDEMIDQALRKAGNVSLVAEGVKSP